MEKIDIKKKCEVILGCKLILDECGGKYRLKVLDPVGETLFKVICEKNNLISKIKELKARLGKKEALRKIKTQFGEDGEKILCFKIIERAIQDAFSPNIKKADKVSARRYLRKDLIHAEIAGVDPDWIRRVLSDVGLAL